MTVADAATANHAGAYFIYDNAGANGGNLYFDANGGNGADAVAFAMLSGVPAIGATNIQIAV